MDRDAPTETSTQRSRELALMAFKQFLDRGYAGTSIAQVAKAASVVKSSLPFHYPSKQECPPRCRRPCWRGRGGTPKTHAGAAPETPTWA